MPKRSFTYIAVPLPEIAKQELESFVGRAGNKYPINWANPTNAQIMLVTLGSLAPDRIEAAMKAVKKVAANQTQLAANAHGLGYFAKERTGGDPTFNSRNRWIVYLDIPDKAKALHALYKNLFKSLADEGFFPTVHFNPRITLGSLNEKKASREQREMTLQNLISNEELTLNDFLIDRINVYELFGFGSNLISSSKLR